MDNHPDQDQEIHQDIIVEKMDKKFESPKIKTNKNQYIYLFFFTGTNVIFVIR